MARLTLSLLGGFRAQSGSGAPLDLPRRKAQALLAYLAVHPGQRQPRDVLASLLWGDRGDEQARQSFRQILAALRKALGPAKPPVLVTEGDSVWLDPVAIEVDVAEFERSVREGTASALERASRLYQGDLLAGFRVDEESFEEWLTAERSRLRQQALGALNRLLAARLNDVTTEPAVETAARLLSLDPAQESVHRALMQLHARGGRWVLALRQYQTCVDVLHRQLEVEPEAETKALYREILRMRASQSAAASGRPPSRAISAPAEARSTIALVGRDGELMRLRETFGQVEDCRGRAVMILGQAGVGKTRLVEEVIDEARTRGACVLVGHCHESEQILPFGPWVDAVRTGLGPNESGLLEDLNTVWRAELARLFPELGSAGVPPPAEAANYLRLFEAVAQLMEHLIARQPPLMLVLEDLHWADDMSLRLLCFIERRSHAWPGILIVTAREEDLQALPALQACRQELDRGGRLLELTVPALSREETLTLLTTLVRVPSDAAATDRIGEQVWAASEGNPFMAVELARALQEGKSPEDVSRLPLPARVREVILGRLGRLTARGQELVAIAAVIGREFSFGLLERAAGLNTRDAADGLEELVRRRIVRAVGDLFDVTHEKIREVAYGQLLLPRRRALHGAVAAALEELHAPNLEPHYTALARHCLEAEMWPKALEYLQHAGSRAVDSGAYREGAACFEQAITAAEHLLEGRIQAALELRLRLRNALLPLGDHTRMLENLREAEALAEQLGDQRRLGWILSYAAREVWLLGEAEQGIELANRVLAIAGKLDDFGLRTIAGVRLGQAYHGLGRYAEAIEVLRRTIDALPGDVLAEQYGMAAPPSVIGRTWLAWCLAELGEFEEAQARAEEGVAIAEGVNQPYTLVAACFGLGLVRLRRGDLDGAIGVLERGMALCQVREVPVFFSWIASSLGLAYAQAGQLARGLPLLEQALEPHALKKAVRQSFPILWLGEGQLLAGRPAEAGERARQALDLARARQEAGHAAYALRLQAEVATHAEHTDTVEELYRRALEAAEALGMRPLAAQCRAGLGRLLRQAGPTEAASADDSAGL